MSVTLPLLLIATDPNPGSHFCVFKPLIEQVRAVEWCAFNQAALEAKKRSISYIDLTGGKRLSELTEEESGKLWSDLRERISHASAILVDYGVLSPRVLEIAANEFPQVKRYVYYDNPEKWVPGSYSEVMAKLAPLAQKIFFASSALRPEFIEGQDHQLIFPSSMPFVTIGYFPMEAVDRLRSLRADSSSRSKLLTALGESERHQKIVVFAGGANKEYFESAWPHFLKLLRDLAADPALMIASKWIIVLQQHPRAKDDGRDVDAISLRALASELGIAAYVSTVPFDIAFAAADVALYHQTTANTQFLLAGLKTIQVAAVPYCDQLLREGIVPSLSTSLELFKAVEAPDAPLSSIERERLMQRLGIESNWQQRLMVGVEP